ncbi:two pore calcium channel protein 1 [Thraustotheca clavata]|uniref:Two pore calcium channel protein 1 n=1 Tax=Thraustotheca clavata TaxID=74557 RepID=A0A1W0A5D2_9STRA|nr:two pore calcium channel protein 1 [Thraustotheca clavata]
MQASFPNSTYTLSGYGSNNFNDIPSGMVTLFELLMVNNWFVIVEGHVLVTSKASRLFFIAFWLAGVIFTLNLFIASILVHRPHPDTPREARFFQIYYRLYYPRRCAVLFLLLVSYVEMPYWCENESCGDPLDSMTPLTFGVILFTRAQAQVAEFVCVAMVMISDILLIMALKRKFLYLVVAQYKERLATKSAIFFRLIIFCATFQTVRSTYCKMYKVLAKVQHIISLVVVYVCFYGWLATILFQDTAEGVTMSSYVESSWQMLILLTTANFPDVMMPAYNKSRWQAIFFIFFLCFGLFFLMNVILAQVFSNFQVIATSESQTLEQNRARMLHNAFEHLISVPKRGPTDSPQSVQEEKTLITSSNDGDDLWISEELCMKLLQELNCYRAAPRTNHNRRLHIIQELNSMGHGRIYCDDFMRICDVMLEEHRDLTPSEVQRYCPRIAQSRAYMYCCYIVQHRWFDLFIDFLLFSLPPLKAQTSSWSTWEIVDVIFSCLYFCEMVAKILDKGTSEYWYHTRNRFDAIITTTTLLIDIYAYIPNSFNDHTIVKVLLTARCIRVLRLIMNIEHYRVIFSTWLRLLPIGKNLLLVLFCNMNFFASLGYALFGGRISPGRMQTSFPTSSFTASGYAANNFNDIPSGMVTLFELLVVNNWFVIAEGHVLVTSVAARFFFIAFWLIGVILTLNLFIASILVWV